LATAAEPIFHMAYISQADQELGYNDIEDILTSARINNPGQKITGVLIHSDGYFVQLLEGPSEKVVKQALSRIIADERHSNLRVIGEWYSSARFFNSPMGFCDSDVHTKHSCFSYFENLFNDSMNFAKTKSEELISFFVNFSNSGIELK
jgi:Sensors of blue-light using FAD